MKCLKLSILIVCMVFFLSSGVYAYITTNETEARNLIVSDTYVYKDNPTVNYGSEATLQLQRGTTTDAMKRIYIFVNLTDLGTINTINNANLSLYLTTALPNLAMGIPFNISIFNNTFLESDPTWNNQSSIFNNIIYQNFTSFQVNDSFENKFFSIDMTEILTNLTNINIYEFSILFRYSTEVAGPSNQIYFVSTEGATVNQRPFLYLNYTTNFTIRANDIYDGSEINNFSAFIDGVGNFSTTDGVLVTNISSESTITYNITLYDPNHFNRTYNNFNVSEDLNAELYQSILNVFAQNAVTGESISSFSAVLPLQSNSTTTGLVTLYPKADTYNLIAASSGYSNGTESVTTYNQQITNITVDLGVYYNFTIYRESDLSPFDVNHTNATQIQIVCPSKTITENYDIANNNNTLIVGVDCVWDVVQLNMDFGGEGSIFRTFIPDVTQTDIPLYMPDLTEETAVQIIFQLNDLTGDYLAGTLIIRKNTASGTIDILEQSWDVELKVNTFLIQNQLYTLVLTDNEGNERSVGSFLADQAGTKTITVPVISFLQDTELGDQITWDWNLNDYDGTTIRLNYIDSQITTTYINFTIYNGSDTSQQLYTTSTTDKGTVTFTYIVADANESYKACFNAITTSAGNLQECRVYSGINEIGDFSAWSIEDSTRFKAWFSLIFMIIIVMIFKSRVSIGLGVATIMGAFLSGINWFTLGSSLATYGVLSLFGLFSVLSFWIEGDKK